MKSEVFDMFRRRKVLLTGHTGFKGSWLAMWLHHCGAEVVGYALAPPTCPSHYQVANVESLLSRSVIADIRDLAQLKRVFDEEQPDLVIHFAAQSVVRTGYEMPVETFAINTMGTVHVLECIRLAGRPCAALLVSTDKCYRNDEQVWGYRECDPMGDNCPYGGSKGAAELAIGAYQRAYFPIEKLNEHGVWLASARAGNVLGGGDWTPTALIVDAVRAVLEHRPVPLRNPHAIRPWQHVLQCLSGYLVIAAGLLQRQTPTVCSGWNIGPTPGTEWTVQQVVQCFLEYWGEGDWEDHSSPNQHPEAHVLRLSIDKALARLSWRPTWDTKKCLEMTASWYRAYFDDPSRIRDFGLQQIIDFERHFLPSNPTLSGNGA